jgi:hypothetical protein
LPLFTELITDLVDDTSYAEFQRELLRRPEKGDVMQHAGGLRKVRLRLPGRGKSGGARVVYLYLRRHDAIVFFYVYTKAKSQALTADHLKRLRNAVAVIKQEFKP